MDSDIYDEMARAEGALVLVTILTVLGSAPRHPGTKMLVRADGSFSGTVGGGEGEARALERAAALMATGGSEILDFAMLGRNPDSTEAICGGVNTMLVESVGGESIWRLARDFLASGRRAVLARRLERCEDGRVRVAARCLFDDAGRMIADSRRKQDVDAEEGFEDAKIESCLASGEAFCSPGLDYFYDSLLPVEKLLILGGGHVGAALATLALPLGFTVWLADDRSGVASEGRLPAGVGLLTGSFPEIVENFPLDPSSYVVVVTRGHSHDLECLRSLLRKDCLYIGLIGSARKTRLILGRLEEDGFSREKVAGLCAPVGLDIGAETPAEIAIAILAEMIAFRRNSPLLPVFLESRLNRRK